MWNRTAVPNQTTVATPECTWLLSAHQLPVYIFLNVLFSCLSISSNVIFLLAIAKSPNLQTVSNFFLSSLAVADLTAGMFVFPLYTSIVIFAVSPSGLWLSIIEKFVWIQSLVSSTFSLALVSVDRYIAVLHPLQYYTTVTERRCFLGIFFVWMLSIILALPAPFLDETGVAITWSVGGVIAVILPFGIISFCYFHIFMAVHRQSKTVHHHQPSCTSTGEFLENQPTVINTRRHQKAAITTAMIVGLFVLLSTPNMFFAFLYAMEEEGSCDQLEILHPWLWGVLIAYSGSFINPWIYGLRTKEFKIVLKQMFKHNSI